MSVPSPVIKQTAKNSLKSAFLPSVIVCCVLVFSYYIVQLLCSLVSVFSAGNIVLLTLAASFVFLLSPLFFGVLDFFNRLLCGQQDSVIIVFKYFSNFKSYKRSLHFTFLISIKSLLYSIVLFFPCFVISLLSNERLYEHLGVPMPVWTSILGELNGFVMFLATLALCFFMLKYYLSAFIFISNNNLDAGEAINMSTIISRRTGGDFFGLVLSFAPWIILSLFVSPIIFILPYFLTSYCVHCRHAINAYNTDVDRFCAKTVPTFSTDDL